MPDENRENGLVIMNRAILDIGYMEVSWKQRYPKSSIFMGFSTDKPSIWGYPHLWNPHSGSICCGTLLSQLGRNNPAELFLGTIFVESSSQVHVKDTHQRQDEHELLYPWREGAKAP